MLKKLNEKNNSGKDLYQNVQTGVVSTLAEATFTQSMRRTNRHMNDNPKMNNRASKGETFIQFIGKKRIFHLSLASIFRKASLLSFYNILEARIPKYNAKLKKIKI